MEFFKGISQKLRRGILLSLALALPMSIVPLGTVFASGDPSVPTGLYVSSATPSTVVVRWTASTASAGLKNYWMYLNGTFFSTASPSQTVFTYTGLTPLSSYTFNVAAVDNNNVVSALSNSVNAKVPANPPSNVTVSAITDKSTQVNWTLSPQDSGITGYYIYRDGIQIGKVAHGVTSYVDNGVIPASTYTYSVAAYSGAKYIAVTTKAAASPATSSSVSYSSGASCTTISTAGNYMLTADVTSTTTPCITIQNVTGVNFDCNSHTIKSNPGVAPVFISQATAVTFAHCTVDDQGQDPNDDLGFHVDNSNMVTIAKNTITGRQVVDFASTNNSSVHDNTFSYASIQSNIGQGNSIINNTFDTPAYGGGAYIISNSGSGNFINANTMDGHGSNQNGTVTGFDDGINVGYESNDAVTNNTLANFWDCGIETYGLVANSFIAWNNISNVSLCGIGAWVSSSFRSNNVYANVVNNTPYLLDFGDQNQLASGETHRYFDNNLFTSNVLNNSTVDLTRASSWFYLDSPLPPPVMVISNNTYSGNNFGKNNAAPMFHTASGFADGGGNICSSTTLALNAYSLTCN